MRIEVTAEDIRIGGRGRCPIEIAIHRARPTLRRWSVSSNGALFLGGFGIKLPQSAVEFVRLFDSGVDPEPFSFELEIPSS